MSREYNGTSDYLGTATTSPITTTPWTISGWFQTDVLAGGTFYELLTIWDNPSVNYAIRLTIDVDAGNDLKLFLYDGSYKEIGTGGTLSTGTWTHVAAVFNSSTSYSIFMNGANKATGSTSVSITHANLNRLTLARNGFSGDTYLDGKQAYWATWNGTALSDSQILELYTKGPLLVGSPNAYWPLTNNVSPETDDVGSIDLTVNGATYSSSNPTLQLTNRSNSLMMKGM